MKTKAKAFNAAAWIILADQCGMEPTVIIYPHGERDFYINVADLDHALHDKMERPLNSEERKAVCNTLVRRGRFVKTTMPHLSRQRAAQKFVAVAYP